MSGVGIIILGNSGVGKSFLGNVILGYERFKHDFDSTAVTIKTECAKAYFNGQSYTVYNIPGLIEADQQRIDLNKREIDYAFKQHPYAVVIFVLGHQGGRPKQEDIVAFNAINDAYSFSQKSLAVIVNNLPRRRKLGYDDKMKNEVSHLLKTHLPHFECVSEIETDQEKQAVRQKLIHIVRDALPKQHDRRHAIYLEADKISGLSKQVEESQKRIEQDRAAHEALVRWLQKEFEEKERRRREEQKQRELQWRREQERIHAAEQAELRRQQAEYERRERQRREQAEYEERERRRRQAEYEETQRRRRQAEYEEAQRRQRELENQLAQKRRREIEAKKDKSIFTGIAAGAASGASGGGLLGGPVGFFLGAIGGAIVGGVTGAVAAD